MSDYINHFPTDARIAYRLENVLRAGNKFGDDVDELFASRQFARDLVDYFEQSPALVGLNWDGETRDGKPIVVTVSRDGSVSVNLRIA